MTPGTNFTKDFAITYPDPDIAPVEAAVAAIQAGTYQIPYTHRANQDEKTAWVQAAVTALIPAGNGSSATVTYSAGYAVSVTKGAITRPATISVTEQLSPVNLLAALTASTGTLNPAFQSDTPDYSLSVPHRVTTFKVTPVLQDLRATITVNGVAVASGLSSQEITLSVGSNLISIIVTAEDGTTKTYTITVSRSSGDYFIPVAQR
jgi:hypothetical protein